jgi:hypothetical protein
VGNDQAGVVTRASTLANPVESIPLFDNAATVGIDLLALGVFPYCTWNNPGCCTDGQGRSAKYQKQLANQHGCGGLISVVSACGRAKYIKKRRLIRHGQEEFAS